MKYKFLLAVMLLLSGCSTPPKEEVKKEIAEYLKKNNDNADKK